MNCRLLNLLIISGLILSSPKAWSQDEDIDFSELDKVEQEEFGNETQGQDTGEFDLETPEPAPQNATGDDVNDLDKEIDNLEGGEKPANPAEDTVDLNNELEQIQEPPLPELEQPEQVAEPEPEVPAAPTEQVVETAPPSPTGLTDEPNEALEARLNRIYQRFLSEQTSDDEWMQIAGDKASESYSVQPGDTLWDISVTLFGNGYFWPKIWQLNSEITNPHIITPGKILKFIPGNLEEAPQLQVTDANGQPIDPDGEEAPPVPVAQTTEEVKLPEPIVSSKPPLKSLPASLPYIVLDGGGEFDETGFSIDKQKTGIGEAQVAVPSYIAKEMPVTVGEIVSVEQMGASTASTYQYVFVKLESATIGQTLTAIEPGSDVEYDSKSFGTPIEYLGSIKVLNRVSGDEPIYKAMVTNSISQVKVGALLIREAIPKVGFSSNGKEASASGTIVGGDSDSNRKVLGHGSFVYLDVGSDQGLVPGDIMSVIRSDLVRNPKSRVTNDDKNIGKIKIAKVSGNRATALIIQSEEAVMPGDRVGVAKLQQDKELVDYDLLEDAAPATQESSEESLDEEL